MWKRLGLWLFVIAGVALMAWGVSDFLNPTTSCRGVEMGPGDVCHYSSYTEEETSEIQSYEDRIAIVRQQVPFVIAAGAAITVFGVFVAVRSGKQGHGAVDDPGLLHERDISDADVDEVIEEQR